MSKSARKTHRPDPTVAPVIRDPRDGELYARPPFEPSAYQADKLAKSAEARRRNREVR